MDVAMVRRDLSRPKSLSTLRRRRETSVSSVVEAFESRAHLFILNFYRLSSRRKKPQFCRRSIRVAYPRIPSFYP